ncbi:MAG: hypothetical protein KGY56_12320, partial [Desulfobacterales bacterium]|nr:hypothetical protein [Desulfobacterales bacterium]
RKLAYRLKQSRPPAQLRQELLRPSCNAPCGSPPIFAREDLAGFHSRLQPNIRANTQVRPYSGGFEAFG